MQIFVVKSNGEIHEVISDAPIKSLLDQKESFILCDDLNRIVYLWKGSNCSVRSKFIGANKLQEVRGQVGLNYRSISMDEDEIGDYPEFLEAIEYARTDGYAREIKEDLEEAGWMREQSGGGRGSPSKSQIYSPGSNLSQKYNRKIEQSGPLYKGSGTSSASTSVVSREDLDKIIESLDDAGIPDGYIREMVIMGNTAYSVSEKIQSFLGKKQVEIILEPISSLPEGIFLAEGYVPRLVVQSQTVVAIEFLKRL